MHLTATLLPVVALGPHGTPTKKVIKNTFPESLGEKLDENAIHLKTSPGAYSIASGIRDDVKVKKMRYSHIAKVSNTWIDAFANDPLFRYLRETRDARRVPHQKHLEMIANAIAFALQLKGSLSFTIKGGAAAVFAAHAADSSKRPNSPLDKFLSRLASLFIAGVSQVLQTPQQKRRGKEWNVKYARALDESIDPAARASMIHIGGLATAPEYQGRGYGSALVETITTIADAQRRSTFLASSNTANTTFYEGLGFQIVGAVVLGDEDETWERKPVVVYIMVRRPSPPS